MKRIFLLLVLFLNMTQSYSQDSTKTWKYALCFRPMGLLNPLLPNANAGLAFKISEHVIAEIHGAYLYNYQININSIYNITAVSGFRAGAELKFFLNRYFYMSAQAFLNRYTKEKNQFYFRYARTYQELITINKQISSYVGHLKTGIMTPLNHTPIMIELSAGIGLRYKMVTLNTLIPEDAEEFTTRGVNFSTDQTGNQLYPSATVGLSILYKLK